MINNDLMKEIHEHSSLSSQPLIVKGSTPVV